MGHKEDHPVLLNDHIYQGGVTKAESLYLAQLNASANITLVEEIILLNNFRRWFLLFYTTCLYIVGLPGNIFIITASIRSKLQYPHLSFLLRSLCVGNLMVLCIGLSRYWWIAVSDGYNYQLYSSDVCYYYCYFFILGQTMTNWILVFVLGESVYSEISSKRNMNCSPMKVSLLLMTLLLTVFSTYYFVIDRMLIIVRTQGTRKLQHCGWPSDSLASSLYIAIMIFLPGSLLVALTVVVFLRNKLASRAKKSLWEDQKIPCLACSLFSALFLSSTFLSCMYFGGDELRGESLYVARMKLAQAVTDCLMYTAYATNYIVYCCLNKKDYQTISQFCVFCCINCCTDKSPRYSHHTYFTPSGLRRISKLGTYMTGSVDETASQRDEQLKNRTLSGLSMIRLKWLSKHSLVNSANVINTSGRSSDDEMIGLSLVPRYENTLDSSPARANRASKFINIGDSTLDVREQKM